jgi:glycosyltransferase involved in cell wall biosynthesis
MSTSKKIRVCHVVESLDVGAVENWLIRSYKCALQMGLDIDWTFYCILPEPGRFDMEVRSLGAEVAHSPCPLSSTIEFVRAIRSFLKQKKFDALHLHHDFLSALYLLATVGLPIKQRIVHVHNTDESLPVVPWKQRLLLEPFRQICLKLADKIVGISNHTLDHFLKSRQRNIQRDRILYYGVDVHPWRDAIFAPHDFREQLDLPPNAKVLLFVGRMTPLKNPVFVVDILKELLRLKPNVFAVFAGTGDLTQEVGSHATKLSVVDKIRIVGWRDDTAFLMKNSDIFIFPRIEFPQEGLGLVVVESQACGLPVLTTTGVGSDAIVIPPLVTILSLDASAKAWATATAEILDRPATVCDYTSAVERSRFNLPQSVRNLQALHAGIG